MFEYDELTLYRGKEIKITPDIIVLQPTLGQIEEFGEKRYFNTIYNLTAVGADMKWQLWNIGIDYTQIDDYDLFIQYISPLLVSRKKLYNEFKTHPEKYEAQLNELSAEDLEEMLINPLQIILKDIDFADFVPCMSKNNNEIVLYHVEKDITINRFIYIQIVDILRKIHGFKRNNQIPANERTKMDLIEDARDEAMANQNKPFKSILKPLISALTVKNGQCGSNDIWNMGIGMFFDNVRRANKIQDAQMLLQGAYSGFASLKDVDKNRLDWSGEI